MTRCTQCGFNEHAGIHHVHGTPDASLAPYRHAFVAPTEPQGPCDHKIWTFEKHGRVCPCGTWMVDFGD